MIDEISRLEGSQHRNPISSNSGCSEVTVTLWGAFSSPGARDDMHISGTLRHVLLFLEKRGCAAATLGGAVRMCLPDLVNFLVCACM